MSIRVLFFGATADVTGQREILMNDVEGKSAKEILAQLENKYAEFSRQRLLLSVNQEYSSGNEIIRDGDELAIFTAVSGG